MPLRARFEYFTYGARPVTKVGGDQKRSIAASEGSWISSQRVQFSSGRTIMSNRFSFPPQVRLHSAADYKAVYDKKCKASDGLLLVFADRNELGHCRLGTSVSKKRGNSVVRHHEKRLIREAFRHCQDELPAGLDLVVIPIGAELSVAECHARLIALAKRLAKRLPAKTNDPSQELTL